MVGFYSWIYAEVAAHLPTSWGHVMANLSFDDHSFLVNGRRVWLASGSIHYARVPRKLWISRIRAAKQAGLNCISTSVFWNYHEAQPHKFNFEGNRDLRRFIELIAAEDMYCLLRPGPYVGADWDFGGLPHWLTTIQGICLRGGGNESRFLEASSRHLAAVMAQVSDLQITSSSNGPIIMVQAENQWCWSHPEQADAYLQEISRYLRENGCNVPINVCNNLWQQVDNTIHTWAGDQHLVADLRQLHVVQPDAPRLVTGLRASQCDYWNPQYHPSDGQEVALDFRIAQVIATGSQYNLEMFCGGTNFRFAAGRGSARPNQFVTTSHDGGAPLGEAGQRGEAYNAVKRVSTFAIHFGHVLANLEPGQCHATLAPDGQQHSTVHERGSQGDIVFLFRGTRDQSQVSQLLLPNGLQLPVFWGERRIAWLLLDANLHGAGQLTYTNLRPWALVAKKMLVLFGPAQTDGLVCINGSPVCLKVPTGPKPLVHHIDNITLLVINEAMVDAAYATSQAVFVGTDGLDENDQPRLLDGWDKVRSITADGKIRSVCPSKVSMKTAPTLGGWQQARQTDFIEGQAKSFKLIDGPKSLESLQCIDGYGWYRLNLLPTRNQNVLVASADRLHLFHEGNAVGMLGGAAKSTRTPANNHNPNQPVRINVDGQVVVLADQLGRLSDGWSLGEQKGIFSHFYSVKPVRMGPPKKVTMQAPDPVQLGGCFAGLRVGEHAKADTYVWSFRPTARKPMFLDLADLPCRMMVLINRKPISMYDPNQSAGHTRILLEIGQSIGGGNNELRLVCLDQTTTTKPKSQQVRLFQCTRNLSTKGRWAFAPWMIPADSLFSTPAKKSDRLPCWHRCQFELGHTQAPLWLELHGMSKGQIYINGYNAGRYFENISGGRAGTVQKRYYLPEPWLHTQAPNILTLFDEHGMPPTRCKIIYSHKRAFDP